MFSIKRETFFNLPKGKCICWLKRKCCLANFRFIKLKYNFVWFRVFPPFAHDIALKALVSAKIKLTYDVSILFLKSLSNLHLPIQFLEGADARCLAIQPYFYPTSLTSGDGQIRENSKMFLVVSQNPQCSSIMNSHEQCI